MKKILLMMMSAIIFSPSSYAIDWYAGVTAGLSKFDSQNYLYLGEADDQNSVFAFSLGMPIEEFFNLEFTYSDFGAIEHDRKIVGVGGLTSEFNEAATSIAVSSVFNYSLSDDVVAFGRAGIEKWEVKIENLGTSAPTSTNRTSGYAPFYGLGLDYRVRGDLHATAEVQYHNFDEDTTDMSINTFQIGLRYFY